MVAPHVLSYWKCFCFSCFILANMQCELCTVASLVDDPNILYVSHTSLMSLQWKDSMMKGVKLSTTPSPTCYLLLFFLPASSECAEYGESLHGCWPRAWWDLVHGYTPWLGPNGHGRGWGKVFIVVKEVYRKGKNALQMIFYQSSSAVTRSYIHIKGVRVWL